MSGMRSAAALREIMEGSEPAPAEVSLTVRQLSQLIAASISRHKQSMDRLVTAMMEPAPVATPAAAWHAQRNAELRARFVREQPSLTSSQVAELAHSRAANRHALASRWRQEGRLISIGWQGQELYPAFQFGPDARPLPAIAQVKEAFPPHASGWEQALWWTAPNSWLSGRRPLDLLKSDPNRVVQAARSHFESLEGF